MTPLAIRGALQDALNAMPGLVPSVVIANSTPGSVTSFTTVVPHGMVSEIAATIEGHSVAALNDSYFLTVTGPSSFTLRDLLTQNPIGSAAAGVGGVLNANLTAWEGVAFQPVAGVPYQKVNFVRAAPENPTFGGGHSREIGFLQVTLYYPNAVGTLDMDTRAELIKSAFPRGSSFIKDGVTVNIPRTPSILSGAPQVERQVLLVRIPYWADIFN